MRKKYNDEGELMNDPFKDMYDSVTDPEQIEKNKHKNDIKQNLENKQKDTGL